MHCITCAFLTMFMHFRYVITMLKYCVLVGLDWAEPMIFFTFTMSHVYAFLMHTYQFCFYHLILNYLVLFCVSLSLSLSLSFVSCSMAPKRKSTPSQNPLRSKASSSYSPSDSTPSHIQFRDDKARKDFVENFS